MQKSTRAHLERGVRADIALFGKFWPFAASGNLTRDLSRLVFNPFFLPSLLCRLARASAQADVRSLAKVFSLLNRLLFGLEIATQCEIGAGILFPHANGSVIGARRLGDNCIIYQGVTIGATRIDVPFTVELRPTIGDNVILASGCKVLGGITIGDDCIVGANAVVTTDLPPGSIVSPPPSEIRSRGMSKTSGESET